MKVPVSRRIFGVQMRALKSEQQLDYRLKLTASLRPLGRTVLEVVDYFSILLYDYLPGGS